MQQYHATPPVSSPQALLPIIEMYRRLFSSECFSPLKVGVVVAPVSVSKDARNDDAARASSGRTVIVPLRKMLSQCIPFLYFVFFFMGFSVDRSSSLFDAQGSEVELVGP